MKNWIVNGVRMEIKCECGKFRASVANFPQSTPGRLKCYCDDCQSYLHYLKRSDLLDANGGTEVIPVYPSDLKILSGREQVRCTRLGPRGLFRFWAACCQTPISNTDPRRAWAGMHRAMFNSENPNLPDQILGPVRASIMGKFAKGEPPPGTPQTMNLKGMRTVLPFMLKGFLFGKKQPSPFFERGGPIVTPHVLTLEERRAALALI